MKEVVSSEEEIQNLYKEGEHAPYDRVKGGYGYYGLLIAHRRTGKIQCHVCGNWQISIGHHLRSHKMSSRDYRQKFGFSLLQPLCSEQLSRVNSKRAHEKIAQGKFANSPGKPFKKGHKNLQRRRKGEYMTAAYWNKHSICPEQIKARVLGLAEQLGHYPSQVELRANDNSLYMLLRRRWGSWNRFKFAQGLPLRLNGRKVSKQFAASAIRRVAKKVPGYLRQQDYAKHAKGLPSASTIGRLFGSWNRALHYSGLLIKQ